MDYKISVIIPIYNVEEYIRNCVCQLLEQSMPEIEYVFVDDCSTDNTLLFLKEEILKYPSIQDQIVLVKHPVNRGVASARNSGLEKAQGEYIGWVDADDTLDKRMFEELYLHIKTEDADIVWCDYYNVNGGKSDHIIQREIDNKMVCIGSLLTGRLIGTLWNKLIRRDLFYTNQIKFPDGLNMSEDLYVCVQLFYYANKITYYPKAFYSYMIGRTNSVSSSPRNGRNHLRVDRIENVRGIENFLRNKNIEGLEYELNILKLMAKKSLLLTAESLSAFKKWKDIFPEANSTMKESDFPWFYKLLSNEIMRQRWLLPWAWIQIKRIKNRYIQN